MVGANLSAGRANTLGLGVAAVLAVATALAQVIDYEFFDLRLRALDSNTHMSIFGAVSLLANAVAVALAISLAVRARNREMVILSGVLAAMFALRVTYPSPPPPSLATVDRDCAGDPLAAGTAVGRRRPLDDPRGVLAARRLLRDPCVGARTSSRPSVWRPCFGGGPGGGAIINRSHAEAIADADLPTGTGHTSQSPTTAPPSASTSTQDRLDDRQDRKITTSTDPLTIGSDPFYGQFFTGLIDEIRVYDTALDTSQIQRDMTTPVAATPVKHSLVTATSSRRPRSRRSVR